MEQQKPLSEILNLLEETKKESIQKIYVPTLDKELLFLPLTADHQKQIVKSIIDSPHYNTVFNTTILNILSEVYISEAGEPFPIDQLTIHDKAILLLNIRKQNIGDMFPAIGTNDEGDDEEKELSLSKHLSKLKVDKVDPVSISVGKNYVVELGFPTMRTEAEFDAVINENLSRLDQSNPNQLKGLISVIFLTNILQYIKKLKIKEDEIDFTALDANSKLHIGKNIESIVVREIINKLDSYFSKEMDKLTSIKFTKNKTTYTGDIKLDGTFFTA